MTASNDGGHKLSSEEIRKLAGPVSDRTVVAIMETGASIADVELAVFYASGEAEYEVTGRPLTGKAALVADILEQDEVYLDIEEP